MEIRWFVPEVDQYHRGKVIGTTQGQPVLQYRTVDANENREIGLTEWREVPTAYEYLEE